MREIEVCQPFGNVWGLQDEINRLFSGAFSRRGRGRAAEVTAAANWAPKVDVSEDDEGVRITAELPGLKNEDVKVAVEEGLLTIRGERRFQDEEKKANYHRIERSYGSFERSFSLPSTLDADKIRAKMENGVLDLMIPRSEKAKPREIPINVQ